MCVCCVCVHVCVCVCVRARVCMRVCVCVVVGLENKIVNVLQLFLEMCRYHELKRSYYYAVVEISFLSYVELNNTSI